ncbi:hypothetical protein M413DRAFT_266499 [Hebeloma cylindrosporum]|uniref:Uncharacterized protein n=1 Tax=Hebeloma cylindrosporum TaxID=76867 RepID=A0A0C3CDU6_HEBCY|nr:hypothetical protein M413DRAFT_266499 [Hebeloma cylindrosporum h7]
MKGNRGLSASHRRRILLTFWAGKGCVRLLRQAQFHQLTFHLFILYSIINVKYPHSTYLGGCLGRFRSSSKITMGGYEFVNHRLSAVLLLRTTKGNELNDSRR